MNPLNINIFYQIFPSSFSTAQSSSMRVHMYIFSIWCTFAYMYIHEGKTNKKLNTRPNFKVKITYTIRPLVLYYWNTTRIGHCDRIKFYSDTKKTESCGQRMRFTESASVLSQYRVYAIIIYTLCSIHGSLEHRTWMVLYLISAKGIDIFSITFAMKENPGFFYIFYITIFIPFGLRYDFRQNILHNCVGRETWYLLKVLLIFIM